MNAELSGDGQWLRFTLPNGDGRNVNVPRLGQVVLDDAGWAGLCQLFTGAPLLQPMLPAGMQSGSAEFQAFLADLIEQVGRHRPMVVDPAPVVVTTPRVPDVPCPKCGDTDVWLSYMAQEPPTECTSSLRCDWYGGREHFHRHCRRCGYLWSTDDVLAKQAGGDS